MPPSRDSTPKRPKLLQLMRQTLRQRNYSPATIKTYTQWVKRFVIFHDLRHPKDMGREEVVAFLNHLATTRNVSASTQNQALCAIVFLYRTVLELEFGWLDEVVRARRPERLPLIFNVDEVNRILGELRGVPWLVASLLYGSGMRIGECLQLRVKDLDFHRCEIVVRDGKGQKDRVTMLPETLIGPLKAHLEEVKALNRRDLADGAGEVILPGALQLKKPLASRDWCWQWVFPATRRYRDHALGIRGRHHLHPTVIQRAFREAVRLAGIDKPATCHSLRHAFATHLLIHGGYNPRTVQELLGHSDLNTTAIYLHVLNKGAHGVRSPLDLSART